MSELERLRLVVAALIAAAVLMTQHGPAAAAEVTGALTGVTMDGRTIGAVLTSDADGVVDPASVTARVDGRLLPVVATGEGDRDTVQRRALVLIDVSGSMRGGGIEAARAAASTFLTAVPPELQVGLATFDTAPHRLVPPTTDRASVQDALQALDPSGETALYDGLQDALAMLGNDGDRTLLVLSDGGDTVSSTTIEQALGAVTSSGVRVDVVGLNTDEAQDDVLRRLASAGSGTLTTADSAQSLADAFAETAQTLASQVVLRVEVPDEVGAGPVDLQVAATAGADTVRAVAQVVLPEPAVVPEANPVDSVAAPRMVDVPEPLLGSAWPVALAVGLAVLVLALLVLAPRMRQRGSARMRQIELYTVSGRRARTGPATVDERKFGQPLLDASQRIVERRGLEKEMALRLDRADLPFRPHEWLVLRVAGALTGSALLALLGAGTVGALVGAALGWASSGLYRRWRTHRRQSQFATQLPDALALVASSLRTGFSLPQALDAVAADVAEPLGTEFGRALAEARLGGDVEDALERVAERMESEDMRWTVMAMRIQHEVGGNLAETLRATVATVRERAMLRRMVRALSAEGRLSAYVLIALPVGMGLYLFATNRDYLSALWTTLLGLAMLVVAAIGLVVGTVWMNKTVKVEV